MNTRKALAKLSKGEKVYSDRAAGLFKDGQRFIDMYDAKDREILAKREANVTPAPFLEVLKKRISKMVQAPDSDMPLVARFDLYSGINKLAMRAPNDNGLHRLAAQLERAWHADPMGALTYGDVDGLVRLYKDQYPRSKAADAIEAECTRVGLHKLPVAKLARIAANINSQSDYDMAMEANGYSGSRAEQVRARTLVRELVNMRGARVASVEDKHIDTRPAEERIAESISRKASLEKEAGYAEAMSALGQVGSMTDSMIKLINQAYAGFNEDGLFDSANKAEQLGTSFEALLGKLTDLRDEQRMVSDSELPQPQVQKPIPNMMNINKELDPQNKAEDEQIKNELDDAQLKQDMGDAGMARKWYDPRTWYKKSEKIAEIVRIASEIAANTDGDFSNAMFAFARDMRRTASRISQLSDMLAPPSEDPAHEMMETPAIEELEQETNVEMTPPPGAEVTPENVNQGVDIVEEIEDAADEIIVEAPPDAVGYIQHEMGEGHTAPPGTAEWGAEEILNEGHEAPPPTDAWLDEELEEINTGKMGAKTAAEMPKVVTCPECKTLQRPGRPCGVCNYPDPGKANITPENPSGVDREWSPAGPVEPVRKWNAAKGKGIPIPEKIDDQPNSKSLVDVPKDGGKVLKATQIEEAVLSGNIVKNKTGSLKLFINDENEVELWHRGAGRVCDLTDLDTAISDFINMSAYDRKAAAAPSTSVEVVDVVDVPCAHCANLVTFKHTASDSDQYVCSCGHATDSSVVNALVKCGHLAVRKVSQYKYDSKQYNDLAMQIASNSKTTQDMYRAVMEMAEKMPGLDPDVLKNKVMQAAQSMKFKQAPQAPQAKPPVIAQMQPPPEETQEPVTDMPIDQVISSAFINYKAQNMALPEAIRTFFKEHQDLVDAKWGPEADAALVAAQTQYYTANAPGVQQVPMQPAVPALDASSPAPAPGAPPAAPPVAAPTAAKQGQKVLEPTVTKKHKDSVSVGAKPLGKDSTGEDLLPDPGSIKVQQGKPDGKISPTDLGTDSDQRDINLDLAGKKPNKSKLPDTNLGKDSEPNEPFKTPAISK